MRGGPRSLSPHLTLPPPHAQNLMFLTPPINTNQVKKSDHIRHWQLLGSSFPTTASLGLEPRPRSPSPLPRTDLIIRRQPAITTRAG